MQILVPYVVSSAMLTASSVAEADYPAWSGATYYAAEQRVIRTATHRVYERVIAGTTATAPEADPTNWLDLAPTNRWAMFDGAVGTVTSANSSIAVTVNITGLVGDIILLGVIGASVTVTLPDVTRTVSVPAPAIAGQGSTVRITGLASAGGACQITLTGTGTVGIATVAIGTLVTVGKSAAGMSGELVDYSIKAFDEFGGLTIVRRPYRRALTVPIEVDQSALDQAVSVLASARSAPVLWLGLPQLGASLVYGLARDWSFTVPAGLSLPCTGSVSIQSMALGV